MKEALQAFTRAKPEIKTIYSSEEDITFILEETEHSTELKGFYFGEPDDEATEKFYGNLKATFE